MNNFDNVGVQLWDSGQAMTFRTLHDFCNYLFDDYGIEDVIFISDNKAEETKKDKSYAEGYKVGYDQGYEEGFDSGYSSASSDRFGEDYDW